MDLSAQIALTCCLFGIFFLIVHKALEALRLENEKPQQLAAVTFCLFMFAAIVSFMVWVLSRIWEF